MNLGELENATVDFQTNTATKTATGGRANGWSTTVSGVPCRHEQITSQNETHQKARRLKESLLFWFDTNPSLTTHMAIVLSGKRYIVQTVEDVAGMGELWQVVAEYVEGVTDAL